MATDELVEEAGTSEADALSASEPARPPRLPFHRDPLSLIGWGIAVAAIVAYWYFFVRTPLPKPGQQIARLTAVEGKVRIKPNAKDAWNEAALSDQLHVGDVVQTETHAGAQISFNSGSVVKVRSDSVVYIGGSAEASTAAWRVQSGKINFSVAGESTEIVTPTVRTTASQNASGNIDVGEAGQTGVKIFAGQAELETSQGQRITLLENQAVQIDAAGRAGGTMELPPPPTLIAPAARARLLLVKPPEPSAQLSWTEVPERRHLSRRARLQRHPGRPADLGGARGERYRRNGARPQGPQSRALLLARGGRQQGRTRGRLLAGLRLPGRRARSAAGRCARRRPPRARPLSCCRPPTRWRPASSTSAGALRAGRR